MAFVKNKFSTYAVAGLIILAVIGVVSSLFTNPIAFLKGIAITIGIAVVIILLIRLYYNRGQNKQQNRSFVKAAKQSSQKHKINRSAPPKPNHNPIASFNKLRIRKKSEEKPRLTVIEGKKGKKKNRASL